MNSKEVLADFQLLGSRVSKLILETKLIAEEGRSNLTYDFDYKLGEPEQEESTILCQLIFIVNIKAKIKNKILFKVDLEMEGLFAGNLDRISHEKFMEMLEINGVVVLLHLARALLLSVTAQSGINPPVNIPMINVFKMREKKRDELSKLNGGEI